MRIGRSIRIASLQCETDCFVQRSSRISASFCEQMERGIGAKRSISQRRRTQMAICEPGKSRAGRLSTRYARVFCRTWVVRGRLASDEQLLYEHTRIKTEMTESPKKTSKRKNGMTKMLFSDGRVEKVFLYNYDPKCKHERCQQTYSGIQCKKCKGWFCL